MFIVKKKTTSILARFVFKVFLRTIIMILWILTIDGKKN